jgi:hypothetical protein
MERRDQAQAKAYEMIEKRLQDLTNIQSPVTITTTTSRRHKRRNEAKIAVPVQCRVRLIMPQVNYTLMI